MKLMARSSFLLTMTKVWYRDSKVHQPRDNVLVEYGVFASSLGRRNAIIGMHNSPRIPTDILGITVVNLDRPQYAREQISKWINTFGHISTVPFLGGKWSYEGGNDDDSYMVAGECKIDQTGRQLRFWGTRLTTTKMDSDKRIVDNHRYEWRSTWARVCVADGRVRVEYQIHKNTWYDGFMNTGFLDGDPDTIEGIFFLNLPPDTVSGRIVFKRLTDD